MRSVALEPFATYAPAIIKRPVDLLFEDKRNLSREWGAVANPYRLSLLSGLPWVTRSSSSRFPIVPRVEPRRNSRPIGELNCLQKHLPRWALDPNPVTAHRSSHKSLLRSFPRCSIDPNRYRVRFNLLLLLVGIPCRRLIRPPYGGDASHRSGF